MANIPRSQAKTINLGLFYGMGKAKLQGELGVSPKKKQKNYLHSIIVKLRLLNS
jgi:DNA polymerase I-like protein with 3'-5' exonuclease and polymerase domains